MKTEVKTGKLTSSYGELTFDIADGRVISYSLDVEAFGPAPTRIDVEEWRRRYPDEHGILAECHDILDFGYWVSDSIYIPPDEDWRKDREENIRLNAEWEEEQCRLAEAEHGRSMQEVV